MQRTLRDILVRGSSLQVAEVQGKIVGVIRGSVKDVAGTQSAIFCSEKAEIRIPLTWTRVGYLLGLRVCPLHRC